MRVRTAAWLAWSACALSLALTALSLVLLRSNLSHPSAPGYDFWVPNTLVALGFSPVGAFVASHLPPKNPMGWLLCTIGLFMGVAHLSVESAIRALLAAPDSLAAGAAAAWMMSWFWILPVGLSVFLFLFFPDGRLPSRRWRWFAWLSALLISLGAVYQAFAPGPVLGVGGVRNPLGIEGLPNAWQTIQAVLFALMFVSVASLFLRRLRSRGVERQQRKWFTFSSTLAIGGVILTYTISEAIDALWLEWVGYVVLVVGFIGIPISMGIAILHYRLYDIDILINRTLVYGSLSATLVALYFGGIVLLQRVFVALTGEKSTLAVVASTLVIAALFNPLRSRVQGFVDSRFYRRKYDTAKTLEAFSAKLRDETDLEALRSDLVGVVRETMQPAHVSLWLRPDRSPKKSVGKREPRG